MKKREWLFCAFLLVSPCRAFSASVPEPNVILISLNALRADHLKIYGYPEETAPNLSRLAGRGVVFGQAVAQSNWTLPSLASLFTSKYVHSLGVYSRRQKLPESELTLAEVLKANGYSTAAFTGGLDMTGAYGLAQGFDTYFDETGTAPMGSFSVEMPRALAWLAANGKKKFFLFLDSYDIHPPFDKPLPEGAAGNYSGQLKGKELSYNLLKGVADGSLKLAPADLAYINSRYDAGITCSDGFLGRLFSKLSELDLSTNTIIILTAEHGEELGDHGSFDRFGTGDLYDEAVRVPLIVSDPRKPGGSRVQEQVALIDVMPTVLDLLGLPAPSGVQGTSLVPLLSGRSSRGAEPYAFSEAGPEKWMARCGGWKLIRDGGKYSLFDLSADPGETRDLAAEKPGVVYRMAQELLRWRTATRTGGSPDKVHVALTPEMKEKLKEAGYWNP
jgi:arylsulfatase A-like enzyme